MKKLVFIFSLCLCLLTNGCSGQLATESEQLKLKRSTYSTIEKGIEKLQLALKNPMSLDVKGVIVLVSTGNQSEKTDPEISVTYNYEAKNDVGNSVEDCVTYYNDTILTEDIANSIDTATPTQNYLSFQKITNGKADSKTYTSEGDGVYSFINNKQNITNVFQLDFSDYTKQGFSYLDDSAE